MKSYPYIGKVEAEGGSSILIKSSKNVGYIIKNNLDDALEGVWESGYNGDAHIKNITAEYLANTYGEVKSKEHAEFIVKLADVYDTSFCNTWSKGKFFNFCIDAADRLHLDFFDEDIAKYRGEKKITIPLPPECESVDEWPKVGDEVAWSSKLSRKGVLLNIYEGMAWVKDSYGEFVSIKVEKLKKPKTPEQELEYNLTDLIMRARDADVDDVTIARSILSKYNITKKGEGDE